MAQENSLKLIVIIVWVRSLLRNIISNTFCQPKIFTGPTQAPHWIFSADATVGEFDHLDKQTFLQTESTNIEQSALTSKIILRSPKQKVEPKGLVLLADEDLPNTTI